MGNDEMRAMFHELIMYNIIKEYQHTIPSKKDRLIDNLKTALISAIKEENYSAYASLHKILMKLIEYTKFSGDLEEDQKKMLRIKKSVENEMKMSLMRFHEIAEITSICSNNELDNSIDNENDGRLYNIRTERNDNSIIIFITCNDGRGLCITYKTACNESEEKYTHSLEFCYYYYPTGDSILFSATANKLSKTSFENNSNVLSKAIIPTDKNRKVLSWDDVPRYDCFMFSKGELKYIINVLSDTIGTKSGQEFKK